ncbi:MAG: methionine synthase [Cyanobacteria bacterium CRU_2_1]|nr:methionine synthase [Cyanobacteria bacterium RU_5_0]NJR61754.1 methionine synthase [Cyanobacteria bacterium CRU_2_1]
MSRGIYITANDRATEQAIALLNSIRVRDSETPVVLIPYDDNYQEVAEILFQKFGVSVYQDLPFIYRLSHRLHEIFGESFFARPNQFRKQACWFGPFDEFLYIDTDIVVFEKIIDNLNYLTEYDFICADYQHAGGITNVFTPKVFEEGIFTETECQDIFNGGFWGSKKHRISEQDLYDSFTECAAHPDYFDFSQKTSDQPIINYMVLKRIPKRFNIVRRLGKAPGNWAGSPHFVVQGDRLFDPNINQPLQYIHWAGMKIQPECPYWEIWEHYRYLNEEKPKFISQAPKQTTVWQKVASKLNGR